MGRDRRPSVVCGLHAVLAVHRHRPDAILRLYHARSRRHEVAPLLRAAALAHRSYREVEPDELERLAKTAHHEGVVAYTTPLPLRPLEDVLERLTSDAVLLALDVVGNPHNLGAILRSAAWFGAAAVLFPQDPGQATLNAAALRVAQGGAEVVACCGVPDLARALRVLAAAGVNVVGAEARGGRPAVGGPPLRRPLCLVVGNEGQGLAPATRAVCAERVSIAGTGLVDSLNVSVAAGVLLAVNPGRVEVVEGVEGAADVEPAAPAGAGPGARPRGRRRRPRRAR